MFTVWLQADWTSNLLVKGWRICGNYSAANNLAEGF